MTVLSLFVSAYQTISGNRQEDMESKSTIFFQHSSHEKDIKFAFFGVFNGSKGQEAAFYEKNHLMNNIIMQAHFWDKGDASVVKAIKDGFLKTQNEINDLALGPTTVTIAFIIGRKIYIGHNGNSGIALGYEESNSGKWSARLLTTSHSTEYVVGRIETTKNEPINQYLKKSEQDPKVPMTRPPGGSLGLQLEVNVFPVTEDFRCLIFASGDLWNVMDALEAVRIIEQDKVASTSGSGRIADNPSEVNPSKLLVKHALSQRSSETQLANNISAITVIFVPKCTSVELIGKNHVSHHYDYGTHVPYNFKKMQGHWP